MGRPSLSCRPSRASSAELFEFILYEPCSGADGGTKTGSCDHCVTTRECGFCDFPSSGVCVPGDDQGPFLAYDAKFCVPSHDKSLTSASWLNEAEQCDEKLSPGLLILVMGVFIVATVIAGSLILYSGVATSVAEMRARRGYTAIQ